jgi:peptidoglycan/LPS O-acetylase OafA/YrhL
MESRATRFPLFDSLRGIACLCVLGAHAAYFDGAIEPGAAAKHWVGRLEVAVPIFLVISGFLLYRPFARPRMKEGRPLHVGGYLWRRLLRIVPAYWVALTAVVIWTGVHGVFTAGGIPTYYGFGQVYRGSTINGGIPQAWTLGVEVVFYALLPLYAALMWARPARDERRRLLSELRALAVLFAASVIYKTVVFLFVDRVDGHSVSWVVALPGYLDMFALGMALAVLSIWYEGRELPSPLRLIDRLPAVAWLTAFAAFVLTGTALGLPGPPGEHPTAMQYMVKHYLYCVVAVGVVIPAVFGDQRRGVVRRILANRALLYLGMVSYGFYLYHLAALQQLQRWGYGTHTIIHPYLQWIMGGLVGGLILGSLSYYLVERPALQLKGLVGPRREEAPGEAIAEPAPLAPVGAP